MALRVTRLAPALGAEITGVDLSDPPDAATIRTIADAWSAYGILVIPDQDISDAAHVRFAKHFGELSVFRPADHPSGLLPEIFRGANTDLGGQLLPPDNPTLRLLQLNWLWHIDSSYRPLPARGVVLRGVEVTDEGGGTVFTNMVAALDAMPAAMKFRVTGLAARHSFEYLVTREGLPPLGEVERARLPPVDHPLVRQHADGRQSLFISPAYMEAIVGWDQPESLAFLDELLAWAIQPRFTYHHHWRPNDVIMWDNAWTMHRVMPFEITRVRRVMHGTTILGADPVLPVAAHA